MHNLKLFKKKLNDSNVSADYKNKVQGIFVSLIKYSNKYYSTSMEILKFVERFEEKNKIKKEMLFFTYDEYLKFINKVDKFEYKFFYQVLYFMGLRQGECMALNWNDINFENKTLSVSKTLTSKIKGESYTISSPKTKSSLEYYLFHKMS